MRKHLAIAALTALAAFSQASAWAATTYNFVGAYYNPPTDYTAPCATPTCANYTTAMRQTGSFTTNAPLAPNLNNANITALVTSYSFNDGIHQYLSTGANDQLIFAYVTTDAAGDIVGENFAANQWQGASHGLNARLNTISVNTGSFTNSYCTSYAISSDKCTGSNDDASTSLAFAHLGGGGAWTTVAAPAPGGAATSVPTLSQWGLLLMAVLLGLVGWRSARRQRGA